MYNSIWNILQPIKNVKAFDYNFRRMCNIPFNFGTHPICELGSNLANSHFLVIQMKF